MSVHTQRYMCECKDYMWPYKDVVYVFACMHACTHGAFVKIERRNTWGTACRWPLVAVHGPFECSVKNTLPLAFTHFLNTVKFDIHVVASNFTERPLSFAFFWWTNHSLTIFNKCRKSAADSTFFDLQAHWKGWFQGSISSGQNILKLGKPWKREATLSMSSKLGEVILYWRYWIICLLWLGKNKRVGKIAKALVNIFSWRGTCSAYLGMICSASCGALSSACATLLPQQGRLQVQIKIVALAYPAYLCRVASSLCASRCVCVCARLLWEVVRTMCHGRPGSPKKKHLLKTK